MPRDHSKEVFSLRLTPEDRRTTETVRRRLSAVGRKASAGDVLRLGLAFLSELSEDEFNALLDGGHVEVRKGRHEA